MHRDPNNATAGQNASSPVVPQLVRAGNGSAALRDPATQIAVLRQTKARLRPDQHHGLLDRSGHRE